MGGVFDNELLFLIIPDALSLNLNLFETLFY